jgi:hypothetical protein
VRQAELLATRKKEFEALKKEVRARFVVVGLVYHIHLSMSHTPPTTPTKQKQYEACMHTDQTRAKNLRGRVIVLDRELKLDEAEYKAQAESISGLLLEALRHFRQAIALEGAAGEEDGEGEEEEEEEGQGGSGGGGGAGPVFRLVALWFEPQNAVDARVNVEMVAFAAEVPTHKVVPLIYQVRQRSWVCSCVQCDAVRTYIYPPTNAPPPQILSRLGSGTPEFARAVETLVYRACKDHPFHTLLQVRC